MDVHGLHIESNRNGTPNYLLCYESGNNTKCESNEPTFHKFENRGVNKLDIWTHHVNNPRAQMINSSLEHNSIETSGIRCGSKQRHANIQAYPSFNSQKDPFDYFDDADGITESSHLPPLRNGGFRGHLPRDVCHVTTTRRRRVLAERVYQDHTERPIDQRDLRLISSVKHPSDCDGALRNAQATEDGVMKPTASSINFSCRNVLPLLSSDDFEDNKQMGGSLNKLQQSYRTSGSRSPPDTLEGRKLFTAPHFTKRRQYTEDRQNNKENIDILSQYIDIPSIQSDTTQRKQNRGRNQPELLARASLLPIVSRHELTPSNILRLTSSQKLAIGYGNRLHETNNGVNHSQRFANLFPKFHRTFSPLHHSPSTIRAILNPEHPTTRQPLQQQSSCFSKSSSNVLDTPRKTMIRKDRRRRNLMENDRKLKHYFSQRKHRHQRTTPAPNTHQSEIKRHSTSSFCPDPSSRNAVSVILHKPLHPTAKTSIEKPGKWWQNLVKTPSYYYCSSDSEPEVLD